MVSNVYISVRRMVSDVNNKMRRLFHAHFGLSNFNPSLSARSLVKIRTFHLAFKNWIGETYLFFTECYS
jgi:hypothetical protein